MLEPFITPFTGLTQAPDRGQSRKEHLHPGARHGGDTEDTGDNGSVVTTEEMVTASSGHRLHNLDPG